MYGGVPPLLSLYSLSLLSFLNTFFHINPSDEGRSFLKYLLFGLLMTVYLVFNQSHNQFKVLFFVVEESCPCLGSLTMQWGVVELILQKQKHQYL